MILRFAFEALNTYKDIKPLPALEAFIKTFKEQHLTAHSKTDVIKRTETIRQETQRGTNEYSTEFKMPSPGLELWLL